ncbi:MAG: DJ-1 family glyoxalase III [Muribaculaceae bacterium]
MKTTYIFLAPGFEEIEALATTDVLRRAGMAVELVSVTDDPEVCGANGISAVADFTLDEVDCSDAEWLICPGGMPGATNLHECKALNDLLVAHYNAGGRVAAICAAPAVVLAPLGFLNGRSATCYPGFEPALIAGGATHVPERVVVDGNVITANGPSSAIPFAAAIITETLGAEVAQQVTDGMLVNM